MNKPSIETGILPPQAVELEQAVLGAILLEQKAAYICSKILKPPHFYKEAHQLIYSAIAVLTSRNEPIDILTVTEELRNSGDLELTGGAFYISFLTNRVASSANIEYHARIVQQKFLLREQIRIASDLIRDAYADADCFELLDATQSQLHSLMKGFSDGKDFSMDDYVDKLQEIEDSNQSGVVPGISTGFVEYDRNSGGHQKGHLIIYAGRPGMGKSARMINEIFHHLKGNVPVVLHSIEMTGVEILARLKGLYLGIPPEDIMKKKLDPEMLKKGNDWLRSKRKFLKIFELNKLQDIERETAILVTQGRCQIMYLDYLQQVKAGKSTTVDNISATSDGLKQIAKKMEIPVVAVTQLSRAVEARGGDKKPALSDLKGSGQIEQDADVVDFVYRAEYYGISELDDGISSHGMMEFINGKMRGGKPNQTILMNWDGPMNKISNIVEDFQNSEEDDPNAIFKTVSVPFDRDSPF